MIRAIGSHGNFSVYFFFSAANSLKCYKCKGPDDGRPYPQSICEKEQIEVTCSSENNTCGKYHHEIKSGALINEVEARSCVADCYHIELSCRPIILAGGECSFSCCDEDLCNTGFTLTPNVFGFVLYLSVLSLTCINLP